MTKNIMSTVWEYTRVIGGALILASTIRALAYEPFKIPSSSMVPTLLIGDYLFVNKYAYGFRNPCSGGRTQGEEIKRGDVVVFEEVKGYGCGMLLGVGSLNFIKRIIAVPGDTVEYKNKELYVNGEKLSVKAEGEYSYQDQKRNTLDASLFEEELGDIKHKILIMNTREGRDVPAMVVPEGRYVVMGDNRDNSLDSREWNKPSWGFITADQIVGRADVLFWSWAPGLKPRWERLGQSLQAESIK